MVGEKEDILVLLEEYKQDEVYKLKVKDLSGKYKNIRRTRPDGNCFYRAFIYAYLERLFEDKEEYSRYLLFKSLLPLLFSKFGKELKIILILV